MAPTSAVPEIVGTAVFAGPVALVTVIVTALLVLGIPTSMMNPTEIDGARRCARKLAEYIYRRDRETRSAEITVTYLMRALRRDRRTVQRYLRQLEHAGYISVEIIHAATRMCAGLLVELLAPLFARHHRRQWPQKLIKKDAARKSQNNRFRIKYSRESWALRCMDGVFRSLMRTIPPLPAIV